MKLPLRATWGALVLLLAALLCAGLVGRAIAAQTTPKPMCAVNTGLNPACPLTTIGISSSFDVLSETTVQHTWSLFVQHALRGRNQLLFELPVRDKLAIANVGTAQGFGDAVLGLNHVLSARPERIMQAVGGTISIPIGADAFSTGRSLLDPFYAISYASLKRVQLVFSTDYAFGVGGTKLPFAPRVQTLRFVPRAIVDVGRRMYVAASASQTSVTGTYRYTSYSATAVAGILDRHLALSISYAIPLGTYSRNVSFYHVVEVDLSVRP